MTSTVKRSVPPPTLVKMGNPLVRTLLGSPLHGVLDDSFLVLHLTGRRTGRRYNIPVGYVDMEGKLTVVTVARWRVNLRGGADVEVTSIPDAIRAADGRSTLIIAGGSVADEPVAARWFRAASPASVQVWVVPHAGHTQGLATAPRAWEAHVIGFLDAALRPA
jgi:hypothetical protein